MTNVNKKYIIIGILIFIASWLFGFVFGSIVLCVGTGWLYSRTKNFWKYPVITLIANAIAGIFVSITFLLDLGIFDYKIENELDVLGAMFIYPGTAILVMLIMIAFMILAAVKFGLQCLSNLITKKFIIKHDQ